MIFPTLNGACFVPFSLVILLSFTKTMYNNKDSGMTGFDGGGWSRMASREVPTS